MGHEGGITIVMEQRQWLDTEAVTQVAGLTGLGWTTSVLAYLGLALGYGNGLIGDPQLFLYLGIALLLTTAGLDRLADTLPDG